MDVLWWQSFWATLPLIALAEIGDKSQLMCMVLAARHGKARAVLFGAAAAFSLLNVAAVLFGAAFAAWLPQNWLLIAMATLFGVFGVHALLQKEADEDEVADETTGRSLFVTTFLMILLAEMGDKTQITVAGLASIYPATAVWIGATIALVLTSAVGVYAGNTILRRLPVVWLHRLAGVFFLALAGLAIWRLLHLN